MAKEIKMPLPSAADLFSTQEERDNESRESVREIPLEEISDFPNHPFKVKMDESMADMAESVKQYGVLVPALVREKPEGGYEMIAGHRRKMASELAEKKEIPCIVRNLTDDEAIIIMVDSNLQREQILPSEKAFAYKMKLDAMKRQQGYRSDLTSATPLQKSGKKSSREILAEQAGESHEQIRKYIRLTELITPILDMVDSGKIAIRPAVELSYLPKEQQTVLLDTGIVFVAPVCVPDEVRPDPTQGGITGFPSLVHAHKYGIVVVLALIHDSPLQAEPDDVRVNPTPVQIGNSLRLVAVRLGQEQFLFGCLFGW